MDNRLIELAKLMCSTDWDDETKAESPDFLLSQFQGTAFASDYKCVKVTTKGKPLVSEDGVFPQVFVAKITTEIERETMLEMRRRCIPIPSIYGAVTHGKTTVLYEELVDGKELYQDKNVEHWKAVARLLSQVHRATPLFKSEKTLGRIRDAGAACQSEPELKIAYEKAIKRLQHTHPTLVHGDMFPTNVLVKEDGSVVFIDWYDAGSAPYVCDLGRLTGMIDIDTMKPFCPCEDAVSGCLL